MMPSFSVANVIKTEAILEEIFAKKLHKKRQQSLAYAAMGQCFLTSNSFTISVNSEN